MTNLQLSIYAMALGFCLFTGILAWRSLFRNRAFLVFIGIIAVMLSCDWLMAHPNTPLKSLWLIGIMAGSFLIAPCTLWLARSVGLSAHPFSVGKHLALVALGWALLLPLASAIHWGADFAKPNNPTSAEYALFIHTTMLVSVALFVCQTLLAVRPCVALLNERCQQNEVLFSVASGSALTNDPGLNTLRLLLIILIANAAIALLRVFYCAAFDGYVLALSLTIVLAQLAMVAFLAISFMQQQLMSLSNCGEALRGQLFATTSEGAPVMPAQAAHAHNETSIEAPKPSKTSDFKYSKSGLSSKRQAEIWSAIEKAVRIDQLFTQPGLSLRDLCEHIHESAHHVSQAISQSEHQNFYALINRQRVALAATLLITHPTASVLDIGFACGFNAKSSFNHAFKKYQGVTPSEYRKQKATIQTVMKPQTT